MKFELTSETKVVFGKTLYRIRALVDFGIVKAGDLGGFVEKEDNLSQVSDLNNPWQTALEAIEAALDEQEYRETEMQHLDQAGQL